MAPLRTPVTLPEVTAAHRAEAFARFAWRDCTYEQAMADPLRGRLVEARAHQLRKLEWKQSQRRPSYIQSTGHADFLKGPSDRRFYVLPAIDLKRAAAGDFDD